MFYIIDETSNTDDGGLYVIARFWATRADYNRGDPYACRESFSWPHLRLEGRHMVRDEHGWPKRLSDGVLVDPLTILPGDETEWVWEDFVRDICLVIRHLLRLYWRNRRHAAQQGRHWPREHANFRQRRTGADPRGLRGAEVRALVGQEWEEAD